VTVRGATINENIVVKYFKNGMVTFDVPTIILASNNSISNDSEK